LPTSARPLHANKELLVDVDNVSVKLGAETVIDRVSFCFHKGEFIGLIGPNGAGKTTLLRVVLGLTKPTTGKVRTAGEVVGYVPQRGALYNAAVPMSVLEVVRLNAGSRAAALRALEETGMQAVASKRFTELSGGQQQRVSIAKALAGNAELLILDEPTTGIDEQSQSEFYGLLQSLQQKGITIVMVSHEVDTVTKLVTRVICLNRSILYDGPPEHFEADKYLPSAYKAQHLMLHHHHGVPHA
jgi:zinc transport system ATP-binding protein